MLVSVPSVAESERERERGVGEGEREWASCLYLLEVDHSRRAVEWVDDEADDAAQAAGHEAEGHHEALHGRRRSHVSKLERADVTHDLVG